MTHHIFLRDSDLWLIVGEVPHKPAEFNYYSGIAQEDIDQYNEAHNTYNATLSRLKSEAVRIGNKDEVMRNFMNPHVPSKEGELYSIEAEVEFQEIPISKRHLVYKFLELPYHVKIKIANKIGVYDPIDSGIPEHP